MATAQTQQFSIECIRRMSCIEVHIREDGETHAFKAASVWTTPAGRSAISWTATSDHRPQLAAAMVEALSISEEIAAELQERGDSQHAPKLDAAQEMIELYLEDTEGKDSADLEDAHRDLKTLGSGASAEEIEAVFRRWSW